MRVAILCFIGLIHASFQLSVSVLTLLGGHSLGRRLAYRRVMGLLCSFVLGALLMTILLTTGLVYYISIIVQHQLITWRLIMAISCGVLASLGVASWLLYYRRGHGTELWLPRSFIAYLSKRSAKTSSRFEAFSLSVSSVIAELPFLIGPFLTASLLIAALPVRLWQAGAIISYSCLAVSSLGLIIVVVGSGHTIAQVQQWRQRHKHFMQFFSGSSLLVMAVFLAVEYVVRYP